MHGQSDEQMDTAVQLQLPPAQWPALNCLIGWGQRPLQSVVTTKMNGLMDMKVQSMCSVSY